MDPEALKKRDVKPLIYEIVNTGVTFPNRRLLVEDLDIIDAEDDERGQTQQGFRLFLTDGEWRIQAVVRSRLHTTCIQADIGRGSVLHLKDYKLLTSDRADGKGQIMHLALHDFYVIGYIALPPLVLSDSGTDSQDEDMESQPASVNAEKASQNDTDKRGQPPLQDPTQTAPKKPILEAQAVSGSRAHGGDSSKQPTRSHSEDNLEDDIFDPPMEVDAEPELAPEPMDVDQGNPADDSLIPRNAEWIRRASIEHHQRCHLKIEPAYSERIPATDDVVFDRFCKRYPLANEGSPCNSIAHNSLLAIMHGHPLRPFPGTPKPITLANMTGTKRSKNHDVDVVAVITHVDASTSKPPRMSLKRDIQIQDPSVDEPVNMSIFVDPVNFRASVGTVALFRHVTTNDWRNGTLNAYPARVAGKEWFIPNPDCLGMRDQAVPIKQDKALEKQMGDFIVDSIADEGKTMRI